ncbi:hypothetical protein MP228_001840 [Amoeboaphelidium protococcarum]|nr:hypothetical protein MP228_001840 [Amoeboaphelidium protococcarum]
MEYQTLLVSSDNSDIPDTQMPGTRIVESDHLHKIVEANEGSSAGSISGLKQLKSVGNTPCYSDDLKMDYTADVQAPGEIKILDSPLADQRDILQSSSSSHGSCADQAVNGIPNDISDSQSLSITTNQKTTINEDYEIGKSGASSKLGPASSAMQVGQLLDNIQDFHQAVLANNNNLSKLELDQLHRSSSSHFQRQSNGVSVNPASATQTDPVNQLNTILVDSLRDIQREVIRVQSVLQQVINSAYNSSSVANNVNGANSTLSSSNASVSGQNSSTGPQESEYGTKGRRQTKSRQSQPSVSEMVDAVIPLTTIKRIETSVKAIQKVVVSAVIRHQETLTSIKQDKLIAKDLNELIQQKPSVLLCDGYKVETSPGGHEIIDLSTYIHDDEPREHTRNMESPLRDKFMGKDCTLAVGMLSEHEPAALLTIKSGVSKNGLDTFEALLLTSHGRFLATFNLPSNDKVQRPEMIMNVALKQFELMQRTKTDQQKVELDFSRILMHKLDPAVDSQEYQNAMSRLARIEQDEKEPNYKFGVLFAYQGQTTEEEMFGNRTGSVHFDEFLSILGDRVKLQGYQGFRGGLDVKNNTTGIESIVRQWKGIQVMFHVSTLLPSDEDEFSNSQGVEGRRMTIRSQQLARKRHIGNDMCLIIFIDGDTPFSADTISSQYCQVFAVVRPILAQSSSYSNADSSPSEVIGYNLQFAMKKDVPIVSPHLQSHSFAKSDAFAILLICKLINEQNAAYQAPEFSQKMIRTRKTLLGDLIETYAPQVAKELTLGRQQQLARAPSQASFGNHPPPPSSSAAAASKSSAESSSAWGGLKKALQSGNSTLSQEYLRRSSSSKMDGRKTSKQMI